MTTKELIAIKLENGLTIKEVVSELCELHTKKPCKINLSRVINKVYFSKIAHCVFFIIRFNAQYYDKNIIDESLDDYIVNQLKRIGFLDSCKKKGA